MKLKYYFIGLFLLLSCNIFAQLNYYDLATIANSRRDYLARYYLLFNKDFSLDEGTFSCDGMDGYEKCSRSDEWILYKQVYKNGTCPKTSLYLTYFISNKKKYNTFIEGLKQVGFEKKEFPDKLRPREIWSLGIAEGLLFITWENGVYMISIVANDI